MISEPATTAVMSWRCYGVVLRHDGSTHQLTRRLRDATVRRVLGTERFLTYTTRCSAAGPWPDSLLAVHVTPTAAGVNLNRWAGYLDRFLPRIYGDVVITSNVRRRALNVVDVERLTNPRSPSTVPHLSAEADLCLDDWRAADPRRRRCPKSLGQVLDALGGPAAVFFDADSHELYLCDADTGAVTVAGYFAAAGDLPHAWRRVARTPHGHDAVLAESAAASRPVTTSDWARDLRIVRSAVEYAAACELEVVFLSGVEEPPVCSVRDVAWIGEEWRTVYGPPWPLTDHMAIHAAIDDLQIRLSDQPTTLAIGDTARRPRWASVADCDDWNPFVDANDEVDAGGR